MLCPSPIVLRTRILSRRTSSVSVWYRSKEAADMGMQRIAIVVTVINLMLLVFIVTRWRSATSPDVADVLRGHGLEIVDNEGRVRASLNVLPPGTSKNGEN